MVIFLLIVIAIGVLLISDIGQYIIGSVIGWIINIFSWGFYMVLFMLLLTLFLGAIAGLILNPTSPITLGLILLALATFVYFEVKKAVKEKELK